MKMLKDAVVIISGCAVGLMLSGCLRVNYKTTEIRATAERDVRVQGRTENLTEAADIAPQVKAQVAEKLQGADQIKMGGVKQ